MRIQRTLTRTTEGEDNTVYKLHEAFGQKMSLIFWESEAEAFPEVVTVIVSDEEETDDIVLEMRRNEELAVKGLRFLCGLEGSLSDLVTDEELKGVLAVGTVDATTYVQVKAIADRRLTTRNRSKQ